jgi:hypothetical protein
MARGLVFHGVDVLGQMSLKSPTSVYTSKHFSWGFGSGFWLWGREGGQEREGEGREGEDMGGKGLRRGEIAS